VREGGGFVETLGLACAVLQAGRQAVTRSMLLAVRHLGSAPGTHPAPTTQHLQAPT
jgi:hypothetical protein